MNKHKRFDYYRYLPITTMGLPRVQFMWHRRIGVSVRIGTRVWTVHK